MRYLLMFISFSLLIACQNSATSEKSFSPQYDMVEESQAEPPRTAQPPPPPPGNGEQLQNETKNQTAPVAIKKKIIRDGRIRMDVDDVKTAKIFLDTVIAGFGGYYEGESFNATDYRATYNLTIRIPNANFDAFLFSLENGGGKIVSRDIKARDVTEEYYDITTRLKNNEAYLKRYTELLNKAKSIKDILEIQEKMRRIEEEMDARKGRIRFIDDKVNYSSLSLTLIQKKAYKSSEAVGFGQKMVKAFKSGFDGFLDFVLMMVHLWPFLLFIIAIWIFGRRFKWSWRRKKKEQ